MSPRDHHPPRLTSPSLAAYRTALCVLLLLLPQARTASADDRLRPGATLPELSLPRVDGTGAFRLSELKGRPAALVFVRPGQKYSRDALDDLQALWRELGLEKLYVVAVDASRSTAEQVKSVLPVEKFTFPIVLDPERVFYGQVGVIVCPTSLLLDAQGVLRYTIAGHPPQYGRVLGARLRFLLGLIDERKMNEEIEPTILRVDQEVAAGWRMYNLGVRLQAEGKPEQALSVFEKAVAEHPTLTEARCALGFMRLAAGEMEVAAQHFQAALAHDPTSPAARLGQAAVLARTGQPQPAEQILLSLLGHKGIAVRVRYELGRIYRLRGELDKADAYFESALGVLFPEPAAESAAGSATRPPLAGSATPAEDRGLVRQDLPGRPGGAPPSGASESNSSPVPGGPAKTDAAASAGPRPVAVQPIAFPADAEFVGVKQCKKCHLQQWKSWQETKMAHAFELLKPGTRPDAKAARKLSPQQDYTGDARCLTCHTNGFGMPGGYALAAAGGSGSADQDNAAVGCESCHGPGSKYIALHKDIQDKQRSYTQAELYQAGQVPVDARVCVRCHDSQQAPCIAPGTVFDYENRQTVGTHRHYDLRFRSK